MDQATNLRKMIEAKSDKIYPFRPKEKKKCYGTAGNPMVLSITSGKGGVGKTNVVGNLAIALQRLGKRVLIFDADLGLANIDIIFGIYPKHNISDVIRGERELAQIIIQGPEGVSVIPASSGVTELANLSEGHKINLLNEFDVLNNMYDVLLIDTGAGIYSNVIFFNLAAQERLLVLTPEPTSITDAYALMKVMFKQHGTKNFYMLVNMARDENEAKSVYKHLSGVAARFMGSLSVNYAGYIPRDQMLHKAVSQRCPVACCYPDSISSRRFALLAEYLLQQSSCETSDGNIKFFWKRLISEAAE